MLKPLEQWFCDSCGEVIAAPKHGYVEWQETKSKKHSFRIVHHALYSPRRRDGGNCYYTNKERDGDLPLVDLLGTQGLIELTSWIDLGEWHQEEYDGPGVKNLREWTTLFRRLHLPYFEEARNYTEEMGKERDGGANDIALYMPEVLKGIVEANEAAK